MAESGATLQGLTVREGVFRGEDGKSVWCLCLSSDG